MEVYKMDIVEFLTSKEIIVVYIVAAVACLLCFIIYLVEKHNDRGRKRHNTRELNKLVEQIKDEVEITPEEENKEPVLQAITPEEKQEDINVVMDEISREVQQELTLEPVEELTIEEPIEEIKEEVIEPIVEENKEEIDELKYTAIEPDVETAKEELHKITEELREQEEKIEEVVENSTLTAYEQEQEDTAIISLEELVKRSKEMYEANELTQYTDEGNEPISISELEVIAGREAEPITSPFELSNVVKEESEKVVLDDFNTIKTKVESVEEVKRFKSSPIISPIYGIEKKEVEVQNELELENTADYDKLDAEIRKTNEFLMTLKELQNKLD
jgi:hypothetical protein